MKPKTIVTLEGKVVITTFRGKYYFLSNFFPCPVFHDEITYPSSEHAYQASKTLKQSMRESMAKLATAADARRVGRKLEYRSDWEDVKLDVMETIVREKFTQNPELADLLVGTGDAILMEGNTWNCAFWGVDARTLEGENHLGKILMKVRTELQAERNVLEY